MTPNKVIALQLCNSATVIIDSTRALVAHGTFSMIEIECHEKASRVSSFLLPPLPNIKYMRVPPSPSNRPTIAEDRLSAIADGPSHFPDGSD